MEHIFILDDRAVTILQIHDSRTSVLEPRFGSYNNVWSRKEKNTKDHVGLTSHKTT